ncbi:hypothetical protein EMQ25_08410 [Arsenicitalea aurantiaca]|uniref:Flagellar protein FlgN n=1 Tax=Arsenicitalea aurantiaca TaxID=1783274 RepID=A0A433XGC4_9HYPH|nr:hypothetical protein [Arsenicitalea aurantiaca]RUT33135.1 hypothetical protein EMQ25_08410 [Arsenicitalea aurantiaca]
MTAADRLAALDALPADTLCTRAEHALKALVEVMNEETTLLRAGHFRRASALTPTKAQYAQDYVGFSRAIQRQLGRLRREAPDRLATLQTGHERLALQMAENLRVIATARNVTEDLLGDVARTVGAQARTRTYGARGTVGSDPAQPARGIAINRAL